MIITRREEKNFFGCNLPHPQTPLHLVSKKAGKRKHGVCMKQAHNSTRTAVQPRKNQDHFRVTLCLSFKTSSRAIPFILKWVSFAYEWLPTKTGFEQRQEATRKRSIQDELRYVFGLGSDFSQEITHQD